MVGQSAISILAFLFFFGWVRHGYSVHVPRYAGEEHLHSRGKLPTSTCVVQPDSHGGDDAPAIIEAFQRCGKNGNITFLNTTYHVESVMNTSGLENCNIDLQGTLLWGTNITYWLNNSLPVGYQNQSSAWILGGTNVHFDGHGYGTLDGNGQIWYDLAGNISNYPRRPHATTIWNTRNSIFQGIRFVQSQMWTTTVIHSENVLLQDIYVNSTSNNGAGTINTDGADTIYANNITFLRWNITNGDDSISQKANSTNIFISDCVFYRGLGIAVGSIGQYNNTFEYIENVTATNITCINTGQPGYIKTWTGVAKGYPPNGGGGGIGYINNVTFTDFLLVNSTQGPFITQCTSYNSEKGDCDTSKFNIRNLHWNNIGGSLYNTDVVASLQCSAASPCRDVQISDVEFVDERNGTIASQYLCDSVRSPVGFNCTGPVAGQNPA